MKNVSLVSKRRLIGARMFLKKWLQPQDKEEIPSSLSRSIEDAVLLGDVEELDQALAFAERDTDFPEELRYGLEALRYFRDYYGPGKILEPKESIQKQMATVMEIAWGAELLEKLRRHEPSSHAIGTA